MYFQCENPIVCSRIDRPPETPIEDGDDALNRVGPGGLDSSPSVAQDNVRLVETSRMPEDGVHMIGDDVEADVGFTSSIRPRDHGMEGLVSKGMRDDDGKKRLCGASLGKKVERRLVGDLRDGCDGITGCGLGDIGLVRRDARDPLCVRLFVDGGPKLAVVVGSTVNGAVEAVDEDLVGDFDQPGRTVVAVTGLGIELDGIDVVGRARGARAMNDAIRIGPGNGGESADQVAIRNGALHRVIKLGCVLEEITDILPGRSRWRPTWCQSCLRDGEVEDRFGYDRVGDLLGEGRWCGKHEFQFAILDGGFIDLHAIEICTPDGLEVGEFLDQVEGWREAIVGRQDLHFGCLDRLSGLRSGVELQTCVEGRVELHVEKFGIVGLEHVRKNLDGVRFRPVEFLASEGFD